MMRVLVTGSTGFVGFHVLRALKNKGHEVVVLVRNTEKAQRLFAQYGVVVDRHRRGFYCR
jgi:dihydroflavonol-4-reductase